MLAACADQPHSAAEVAPITVRRPLDRHLLTFAVGEAIAHLHGRWLAGKLRRVAGVEGVFRFARA